MKYFEIIYSFIVFVQKCNKNVVEKNNPPGQINQFHEIITVLPRRFFGKFVKMTVVK